MDIIPSIAWENLFPFLLACIVIESTPGPNMAFLTVVSATKGRNYGYATVMGVTLGLLVIGFAAAAGLATVLSTTPILYHGLRMGGVLYLLWLALTEWRNAGSNLVPNHKETSGLRSYFQHGLIVNILNPKAAIFYVTVLPGFINPDEFVLQQAVVLTLISVFIATVAHLIIVSLAALLKPFLEHPTKKRSIRRSMSVGLAFIAIWIGIRG